MHQLLKILLCIAFLFLFAQGYSQAFSMDNEAMEDIERRATDASRNDLRELRRQVIGDEGVYTSSAADTIINEDIEYQTQNGSQIITAPWEAEELSRIYSEAVLRGEMPVNSFCNAETMQRVDDTRGEVSEELESLVKSGRNGIAAYIYAMMLERYARVDIGPITDHERLLIRSGHAMSCLDLKIEDVLGEDEREESQPVIIASAVSPYSGGKTERKRERARRDSISQSKEDAHKVNLSLYSESSGKVDYFRLFLYIWEDIPGEWRILKTHNYRQRSSRISRRRFSPIRLDFNSFIQYISHFIINPLKSNFFSNNNKNILISFLGKKISQPYYYNPYKLNSTDYHSTYNFILIYPHKSAVFPPPKPPEGRLQEIDFTTYIYLSDQIGFQNIENRGGLS